MRQAPAGELQQTTHAASSSSNIQKEKKKATLNLNDILFEHQL
jgi:hypothetical protein